MTTESRVEPPPAASPAGVGAKVSLLTEIRRLVAMGARSPERNRLLLVIAGLVAVVAGTAFMQTRLNAWNQPFYDALTHKDLPAFLTQLGVFARLAAILLVLNVS